MDTPPPDSGGTPVPPSQPDPVVPAPPPAEPPPPLDPVAQQWAVAIHLSALSGFIIPVGNILAPLIIWLIKKSELPALDQVGKDVLNFQISYTIYAIVSVIAAAVLSCLIVPIILPIAVFIAWLVFTIIGGIKMSNGERYVFPLALKML